jgi:hypothetical protein
MLAAVAAIGLMLGSPGWQPQPPGPPTVWAEAGARPWGQCRELERGAEVMLAKQSPGSEGPGPWAERARLCPGAPAVLVAAAMIELTEVPGLPPLRELVDEVGALADAQRMSRKRASQWLAAARTEAGRRGEAPPPRTWIFTAIAAIGLGEAERALSALREAELRAEVEQFRIDRLVAVAALMSGDLSRALALAQRARELGPGREQVRTGLILALVYDRSGAPDAALRELTLLRPMASSGDRAAIDALLPLHERLYLAALEQIAFKNPMSAAQLFKAYLASPAPQEQERRLAERRLAELKPAGS